MVNAGIMLLHIGINSSSALPNVPPISWWRNIDGKEIILVVQGDYGMWWEGSISFRFTIEVVP